MLALLRQFDVDASSRIWKEAEFICSLLEGDGDVSRQYPNERVAIQVRTRMDAKHPSFGLEVDGRNLYPVNLPIA